MKVAVCIPYTAGRMENLVEVLACLRRQTVKPSSIVILQDGPESWEEIPYDCEGLGVTVARCEKHEPGMEQPRNVGVRVISQYDHDATHVWFLDSDIIVQPDCLQRYVEGHVLVHVGDEKKDGKYVTFKPMDRILIGPYEWMEPGCRRPMPELHNDPRWPSFSQETPLYPGTEDHMPLPTMVSTGKLNDGLACFSGNLVWPIAEFIRIGGFWNEIHHGRCEDGELGLRAVYHEVPISFVPDARGYHLYHPVNMERNIAANTRDVPMLNERHPWVEGEDLFVVERDGRRFEQRCGMCGELINTVEWWAHVAEHGAVDVRMPDPMPEAS